jgi:hypothetical protein
MERYTVPMPTDTDLRVLVSWLPAWEELGPVSSEIEQTWRKLRELRAQAAEIKARLSTTCPLDLSPLEIRLWSKVDVIDDDTSCWEWKNSRRPKPDNYGQFRWTNPITKKTEVAAASRVALFLTTGELPDHACHTCDNPPCCRPAHLYDGTHIENMRDRLARGRYGTGDQRGTNNPSAKLTDELVIMARNLARTGMQLKDTHERVGYEGSATVLRFAITGRTWKHLNSTSPPVVKR